MEKTKGWCVWKVSLDYLIKALNECTAGGAEQIQVVNSEDKLYPFLILYYNPEDE